MANTIKEKELKTKWPFVEGTTLGTTKISGRNPYLVPEKSLVPSRYKKGICT